MPTQAVSGSTRRMGVVLRARRVMRQEFEDQQTLTQFWQGQFPPSEHESMLERMLEEKERVSVAADQILRAIAEVRDR
jgi:hypothetical protein